jgi:SulP family sulfate permease
MVAVAGLVDVKLPVMLWKSHKVEAVLLLATFLVTATIGMTQGIATGVSLSLIVLVYRQMRPHFTELGEIEGVFRNVNRFQNTKVRKGLLIVRFDSALHFANHRFLQSSLKKVIETRESKGDSIENIILCAEAIGYIDASGISALENLIDELESRKICFRLAAAIGPVRDVIESSDLIKRIGETRCFTGIDSAIADLEAPGSINDGLRKVATQVDTEEDDS